MPKHKIRTPNDPWLRPGYDALNHYFGHRGEMETPAVIDLRLHWNPATANDGYAFQYEMIVLTDDAGKILAVRDHSVIVPNPPRSNSSRAAIVHLSHIWIAEEERGKHGAFLNDDDPIQIARDAIASTGLPDTTPIVLVAEAEPYQADNVERVNRLRIFRAMRYKPVDPSSIVYLQPDFRPPSVIDAEGGPQPLPLTLLIKQIGNEKNDSISADEVRHIVTCLYRMYGAGMQAEHMHSVYDSLANYPSGAIPISLLWKNTGLQ